MRLGGSELRGQKHALLARGPTPAVSAAADVGAAAADPISESNSSTGNGRRWKAGRLVAMGVTVAAGVIGSGLFSVIGFLREGQKKSAQHTELMSSSHEQQRPHSVMATTLQRSSMRVYALDELLSPEETEVLINATRAPGGERHTHLEDSIIGGGGFHGAADRRPRTSETGVLDETQRMGAVKPFFDSGTGLLERLDHSYFGEDHVLSKLAKSHPDIVSQRWEQQPWSALIGPRDADETRLLKIMQKLHIASRSPYPMGEPMQVSRYTKGKKYDMHLDDAWDPHGMPNEVTQPTFQSRFATVLVYLNKVESGGYTIFPKVGQCGRTNGKGGSTNVDHNLCCNNDYFTADESSSDDTPRLTRSDPIPGRGVVFFSHTEIEQYIWHMLLNTVSWHFITK